MHYAFSASIIKDDSEVDKDKGYKFKEDVS